MGGICYITLDLQKNNMKLYRILDKWGCIYCTYLYWSSDNQTKIKIYFLSIWDVFMASIKFHKCLVCIKTTYHKLKPPQHPKKIATCCCCQCRMSVHDIEKHFLLDWRTHLKNPLLPNRNHSSSTVILNVMATSSIISCMSSHKISTIYIP